MTAPGSAFPYAMADLLPHRPPLLLLDEVVAAAPGWLTAAVTIRSDSFLGEPDGVPSQVGLEYMAQTCGAYAGWRQRSAGKPIRVGFLLGTRRYHAAVLRYPLGSRLEITAEILTDEADETAAFLCRIVTGGMVAAEAQLVVHQPPTLGPTQEARPT